MQGQTYPFFAPLLCSMVLAALAPPPVVGATNLRSNPDAIDPITRPHPAAYRLNKVGSVTLRGSLNWSCASRETVTFSREDLTAVRDYLRQCQGDSLHDRVQRLRVGIWQMQLVAQKYLPELANDREINEFDKEVEGRLDCVDSASNTTAYLKILMDLAQLPGWSLGAPEVRNVMDFYGVHWTAVVTDQASGKLWSVDSWFRPHGHLPFVMPLADWAKEKKGWEPPFSRLNPYPESIQELCPAPRQTAEQSAAGPTALATLRRGD